MNGVVELMHPLDVILTALDAQLRSASPCLPMSMNVTRVQGTLLLPEGGAVFTVDYALFLSDSRDARIADIALTLALPCTTAPDIAADDLRHYACTHLYGYLHDYLREHLHWLTVLLGLSPLVIEPFTPAMRRQTATAALAAAR